eukprot:196648-Prymnesium_polylepis.1
MPAYVSKYSSSQNATWPRAWAVRGPPPPNRSTAAGCTGNGFVPPTAPNLASFLKQTAPVGDSPYCAPSHSTTLIFLPIIILTESTTSAVTPGTSWLVSSSRTNRGRAARSLSSRSRPQPESVPMAGSMASSAFSDDSSPTPAPPVRFGRLT